MVEGQSAAGFRKLAPKAVNVERSVLGATAADGLNIYETKH
jgi:hypothetical protein